MAQHWQKQVPQGDVTVSGIPENQRALRAVGDVDTEKAGQQSVEALLPYVERETRVNTGILRSAWNAQQNAFVNETSYAGYQEYGTQFVDPTHAIGKSLTEHGDLVEKAFETEVDNASRKAGFSRI